MTIEEALTIYLLARPGLAALIGTKLYPDSANQNDAMPYVVYIDVNDVKIHTLDGQLDLEQPTKQYTVYAATKAAAANVAAQLKLALNDYYGTLSGVNIQKIELQNEFSTLEQSGDGTVRVYTHDLEYDITYERN